MPPVQVDQGIEVHPESPVGRQDAELRRVGASREMDFAPADHLTLGEGLDIIDVKRAAKVSGSRFAFLKGKGALLELALVRYVLDRLMAEGFVPVIPPVLVREEAMYGTGFFPTDEAQVYKTADDDLYLAGTSEVPIASMHSGEIFAARQLPLRYAGISTCFRREAGTYGKDTRGIIRVHQFDKVEMFSFCRPEESDAEHGRLLGLEEAIFQGLEIPYRVLDIAAGELAAPNYRKFDIEAWLPGADRWLEVTSCSNDWDFQARRLGVRFKEGDSGTELVHTLNGTAVAIGRAIVALLENHQQADGSVAIPDALRPYTGWEAIAPEV
ncbi:MAG TPA: serine--tRNA ligase [Actinomycetota bacterium]|nr:serine--tRNA ligase [Actinomycetota bacterium]